MVTLPFVRYNERKAQALEVFAAEGPLRPPYWAVLVRPMVRSKWAYWYLKRLWRFGYLHRKRDYKGRIVYQLSPKGAWWRLNLKHDPAFRRRVLRLKGSLQ